MSNNIRGFMVLWSVPESLSYSFEELEQMAEKARFDSSFVPLPKKKRNAWEKATNLGAKGKRIEIPEYKMEEIKRMYGVSPVVKLHTAVIKKSAPLLIRHITREVTIPITKDSGSDIRETTMKQLSHETVAVMSFDCETEKMRSEVQTLGDREGFVNGNLVTIVQGLMNDVDRKVNYADGQSIRDGIRGFLLDRDGILMSSGGAYFLPNKPGIVEDLKSAKFYIQQMGDGENNPSMTIFPLTDEGEIFEASFDVSENAIEQIGQELKEIARSLQPVLDGERTKYMAEKSVGRATVDLFRVKEKIETYRSALNDKLIGLDAIIEFTSNAIEVARTSETFRDPSSRNED